MVYRHPSFGGVRPWQDLSFDIWCHIWHHIKVVKAVEKIWEQMDRSLNNVRFSDFCRLIEWFGFQHKGGKGSHKTYFRRDIQEIIDIQPLKGEAKPYQIRQFLRLVRLYNLKGRGK